jgi:hypothetical protein
MRGKPLTCLCREFIEIIEQCCCIIRLQVPQSYSFVVLKRHDHAIQDNNKEVDLKNKIRVPVKQPTAICRIISEISVVIIQLKTAGYERNSSQ